MNIALLSKKIAVSLQAAVMVMGVTAASVVGVAVSAAPAYADPAECANFATDPVGAGAACSQGASQKNNLFGAGGIFTTIANTLIFLVGAISVIYLIVGGLRYVTSGGDSKAVTTAKDTILYAVVGIVVAIISYAVVNFVITALAQAN